MHTDFDQDPPEDMILLPVPQSTTKPNGKSNSKPAPKFAPVSMATANAAKKGNTSTSRTGEGKQISFEFSTPTQASKNMYFRTHPSAAYHAANLPVYYDENHDSYHYIDPTLYESGLLPDRFQSACKLQDCHVMGVADGTFFIWKINVSDSKWRKAAIKVLEASKSGFIVIQTLRSKQTYAVEPAPDPIPEPRWSSLPQFDSMLNDAFDSVVSVADDKVVLDFMSGGVSIAEEMEAEGEDE